MKHGNIENTQHENNRSKSGIRWVWLDYLQEEEFSCGRSVPPAVIDPRIQAKSVAIFLHVRHQWLRLKDILISLSLNILYISFFLFFPLSSSFKLKNTVSIMNDWKHLSYLQHSDKGHKVHSLQPVFIQVWGEREPWVKITFASMSSVDLITFLLTLWTFVDTKTETWCSLESNDVWRLMLAARI